jgi:hypothetical protein
MAGAAGVTRPELCGVWAWTRVRGYAVPRKAGIILENQHSVQNQVVGIVTVNPERKPPIKPLWVNHSVRLQNQVETGVGSWGRSGVVRALAV